MKVLVIDDHATVRQLTSRLLACLGHQSLLAADAREAEDAFRCHAAEVELVLMDLEGTDGAALARRLESARSDLPILFMSGHDDQVFTADALAGPHRRFLRKPFSLGALDRALGELLSSRP